MSNDFWGYILAGLLEMLNNALLFFFPVHEHIGMAEMLVDAVTGSFALVFMILLNQMDMKIVAGVIGIILVLEAIRALVAIWEWVKSLLPTT